MVLDNILFVAVAVENGRFAHDELFKDDSCYDLVLQELFTPEMVFIFVFMYNFA